MNPTAPKPPTPAAPKAPLRDDAPVTLGPTSVTTTVGAALEALAGLSSPKASGPTPPLDWTPQYSPYRHGGWYVDNVRYPSGACGCVSNNYEDKKWRIVCDHRRNNLGEAGDFTFKTRDAAARAEWILAASGAPEAPTGLSGPKGSDLSSAEGVANAASAFGISLDPDQAKALALSVKCFPDRYVKASKLNPDAVSVFLNPPNGTKTPHCESSKAPTPWGRAQDCYKHAEGITMYSTPSHGGYKVNKKQNERIPEALRNEKGWYEEDCEWAKVAITYPELFTASSVISAHEACKKWSPDGYAKAFGIEVKPEDSLILRERLFRQEHANDYIGLAAWGDWHEAVPKGMVGVFAGKGGRQEDGMYPPDTKWFLVPVAEYDQRKEIGFIVDPSRHQEIEPFA